MTTAANLSSVLHQLADALHAVADASKENDPGIERMLTADEAKDLLSVSRTTISSLLQRGELPAIKVKGFWRIRPEDLRAYMVGRAS